MRHLVISYHTCPLDRPGRDLAGGMNVLLKSFLAHTTWPTDLVTRGFGEYERHDVKPGVAIHRLPCGASRPWTRELAWDRLPAFRESFERWLNGRLFDVASAHYWMSGTLLRDLRIPSGIMFHTLQVQKGKPVGELERRRRDMEKELVARFPAAFLHWHDLRYAESLLGCVKGSVVRAGHGWEVVSAFREEREPLVFGWAARRDAVKNFDQARELLTTLRMKSSKVRMLVAGMEEENEEGITFLGQLETEEMAQFYAEIDQLWNLSHYETFGLGVLEALTQGATVGLLPGSDWGRRLRRLGIDSSPGRGWSQRDRRTALLLSRAYHWSRALPSWERWLSRLATARR